MLHIPHEIKTKLPNMLTIMRILVIPLFVSLIYLDTKTGFIGAVLVFTIAAITDIFDGYLARYWKVQSMFGVVMDSIADKLLVITALVMLIANRFIHGVHVIPALLIITREVLMSGVKEYCASCNNRIKVSSIARWKTAIQCIAVCGLIIRNIEPIGHLLDVLSVCLLWIAAILTIYTLFDYIVTIFNDKTKWL